MKKVSPFDCVLLNTLPFSEKDFLEDLTNSVKHDFCASILRKNSALNNDGAWIFYKPILSVLSRICIEAKKLGVKVITHAVLDDLKKYSEKYEVITLIAHSRLSGIMEKDILNSIELLHLLKNPKNKKQEDFSKMIEYENPELLKSLQNDSFKLKQILTHTLNTIVEKSHRLYMYPPSERLKDNNNFFHYKKFTRVNLEQAFPGLIRVFPIIEFRDNMYSIMDVISNIDDQFSGFLDLTVCNSLTFGDTIKSYRPSCIIAINQYQASIDVRMVRYKAIIKMLSYQKDTYLNALKKVHTAFLKGDSIIKWKQ